MQRNAMIPTAGNLVNVVIPSHRVLTVKRFTSDETGEFLAPVSSGTVTVRLANDVQSVAKTVRPARRVV